jgi:hypothetical protein
MQDIIADEFASLAARMDGIQPDGSGSRGLINGGSCQFRGLDCRVDVGHIAFKALADKPTLEGTSQYASLLLRGW